jgi:hypothetical protein
VYNTTTIGNPKTAQLTNCTVAYNIGQVGSQLYASIINSGLLVANTLIVGEPGGDPNCSTNTPGGLGVVSLGGNVSSDNSVCNLKPAELGDHVGVTASGLATDLADNGGETLTLSIPEDSPVAGVGLAIHCPTTDQRGVDRPLPCAVGAFEPEVVAPLACGEASEVPGKLRAGITGPRIITASDALIVLSASVGIAECPLCVCDVNDSGGISATDALLVRYAVGQPLTLQCPPCS